MHNNKILTRRRMLGLSVGIGFAAILRTPRITHTVKLQSWPLWATFQHRANLIELGRNCLIQLPSMQAIPLEMLSDAITIKFRMPGNAPLHAVGPALVQSIRSDFASGDARQVDGWYISKSEILLAILAFKVFGSGLLELG